jgi:hypothetical protein
VERSHKVAQELDEAGTKIQALCKKTIFSQKAPEDRVPTERRPVMAV